MSDPTRPAGAVTRAVNLTDPRPGPTLRAWLAERPFTLGLSSGFFGFFAHAGVLSVLEDEGLLPAAIAGSSAGALTGGLWAAGLDAGRIADLYLGLRKADFWDPAPGPGLLRGARFRGLLRAVTPVRELEDCRCPLALSAFDLLPMCTRVLRTGGWVESVYASCAVPLMFRPIRIGRGWYVDGGLADRPGLRGVEPGTRVFYHHLAVGGRGRTHPATGLPARDNMASLIITGLPRPAPDSLALAGPALAAARDATRRALDRPLGAGMVTVEARARESASSMAVIS
jgi:NTE family protein